METTTTQDTEYEKILDILSEMKLPYVIHSKAIELIHAAYHLGKREAFTDAIDEMQHAINMTQTSLKYCK